MSSHDRTKGGPVTTRRQAIALIGATAAASALAACQPLYGTTPGGANLQDIMAGIEITKVPGRVGQRVRNELIFTTTGGGRPAEKKYRLDISLRETVSKQQVERSGQVRGELYKLDAKFKLVRLEDNKMVLDGRSTSRAAYNRVDPIFANVRARIDAENRAARIVADGIKTRIAAFLSGTA